MLQIRKNNIHTHQVMAASIEVFLKFLTQSMPSVRGGGMRDKTLLRTGSYRIFNNYFIGFRLNLEKSMGPWRIEPYQSWWSLNHSERDRGEKRPQNAILSESGYIFFPVIDLKSTALNFSRDDMFLSWWYTSPSWFHCFYFLLHLPTDRRSRWYHGKKVERTYILEHSKSSNCYNIKL